MQHSFDKDIAVEYGVLEAILLNNICFWILKNKANNTNFYDGDYWTFNSTKAFTELFPYASKRQIEKALMHLREENILKVGNYNANAYDRTLWYALTSKGKCILQFGDKQITENVDAKVENVTPIPYINTNNKNTNIKHKYGFYSNVLLSDDDMEKLKAEFPTDWQERIDRLSEYIASTGKSYRNHLATIRSLARKDKQNDKSRIVTGLWSTDNDDELPFDI